MTDEELLNLAASRALDGSRPKDTLRAYGLDDEVTARWCIELVGDTAMGGCVAMGIGIGIEVERALRREDS